MIFRPLCRLDIPNICLEWLCIIWHALTEKNKWQLRTVISLATETRLTLEVSIYEILCMVRDEDKEILPDTKALIWDSLGRVIGMVNGPRKKY